MGQAVLNGFQSLVHSHPIFILQAPPSSAHLLFEPDYEENMKIIKMRIFDWWVMIKI